jgi:hypothetical protein
VSKRTFRKKSPQVLYFNEAALRNENERLGDRGPDTISGLIEKPLETKSTFDILDSLKEQKDVLATIFC